MIQRQGQEEIKRIKSGDEYSVFKRVDDAIYMQNAAKHGAAAGLYWRPSRKSALSREQRSSAIPVSTTRRPKPCI